MTPYRDRLNKGHYKPKKAKADTKTTTETEETPTKAALRRGKRSH